MYQVTRKLTTKRFWLIAFVSCNLLFILLQIYKQSLFVKVAYTQQRLERERDALRQHKAQCLAELHTQRAYSKIKQFAVSQLGMQPIQLSQIHKWQGGDGA